MSIRFETDRMPNKIMLLDQAAGVGIEFEPGSLAETQFLQFCDKLWMHGLQTGVDAMVPSRVKIMEVTPTGVEQV
jgi:urease beta subunit